MDVNIETDVLCGDNFNIPVVDLSYLNSNCDWGRLEDTKIEQLAQSFGNALQKSGLIFIENHGVSEELVSPFTCKNYFRVSIQSFCWFR